MKNFLLVLSLLTSLFTFSQNKKEQIHLLTLQVDSLKAELNSSKLKIDSLKTLDQNNKLFIDHILDTLQSTKYKLKKSKEELTVLVDSIQFLNTKFQLLNQKLIRADTLLKTSEKTNKDLQNEIRLKTDLENELNENIKNQISKIDSLNKILSNSIPTITIIGNFISAYKDECGGINLRFKDSKGNDWEFSLYENFSKVNIFEYVEEEDEKIIFNLKNTVTITLANFYGVKCISADNMDAGNIVKEKTPMILDIQF